ncbi:MAG: PSD1 and planctomycete cytochrome C domain-containing protein [Deltaproteobacteria bacterium]
MKNWHFVRIATGTTAFLALISGAAHCAEPSAEDIEFFEKQVRPVLVETCQKCHGDRKQEGGLRLDSRSDVVKGGDSGAAVEPGKPDESLLVEAIRYLGEIKMPPKGKLADDKIAALTEWVKRGAPWPAEKPGADKPGEFNLAARRAKQWAFQPVRRQAPPPVKNRVWPRTAVDNFILAKLDEVGVAPAEPADKRTLLRRVTFDLVGLPPSPAEIDAFLADDSPQAFERVVNRLLDSPHYGERWGRHWLDLVRFAETHGHEFDFEMPLAFEYRDYVIRALNADVPYNQFVVEHVAGDLLAEPRRHPADGVNESIIGTGFWYLGEATHSPVDVRADEATRIDNQIDVFGKTFLAQTLACARCHDHKFDAISTKDYYALSGYLQSSRYDVACIDPPEERLAIVKQLQDLQHEETRLLQSAAAEAAKTAGARIADCLLASLAVLRPEIGKAQDTADSAPAGSAEIVFEDFEKGTYGGWMATGNAFGEIPNRRPLPDYQGEIGALGRGFVNSHSALDKQGKRTATDGLTGTLTSSPFKISRPYIHFLIGGGAHDGKTCLNLVVDGKAVRTATGRNENRMDWSTFDVHELAGKDARFEIVDQEQGGWGNIGVDHLIFSNIPTPEPVVGRIAATAKKHHIEPDELAKWVARLHGPSLKTPTDPFHLWALLAARPGELTSESVTAFIREQCSGEAALTERLTAQAERFTTFEDFSNGNFDGWFVSGEAFGSGPVAAAAVPVAGSASVLPGAALGGPVVHSGRLSGRLEGTLRSRTFTIEKNRVLYHVAGKGAKVNLIIDSHQLIRNPIYGGLTIALDNPDRMQWYAQDVSKWVGHNAYIELIDPGEGFLAIDRVLFSDEQPPAEAPNEVSRKILEERDFKSPAGIARAYARLVEVSLRQGAGGGKPQEPAGHDRDAERHMLQWLTSNNVESTLSRSLAVSHPDLQKRLRDFAGSKSRLESALRYDRKAMAMTDGSPEDDRVHLRGSPHKFADVVPRRFLEALAGPDQPPPARGSGRLELARRMVDPANPLLARVLVNRVWQHHFGEGLVRTPDDFGNMGQPPTHPELLDYLANEFVKQGWSLKNLHRLLVLSRTYQMASTAADPRADEIDPQNKLWHRMNLRRLEAETIRDSILAVSGRLDGKMYGPGVMPYLTPFMVGRGRPGKSGPLDGDGRRTVYLNVRRNFLTPMLLAFDYPIPFSTIGRRSVSNVPAQALALMNNPFVLQQAEIWARRVLGQHSEASERIRGMYISAFARLPTGQEEENALAFLAEQSRQYSPAESLRPWTDLAHVLFNVKEFIFID